MLSKGSKDDNRPVVLLQRADNLESEREDVRQLSVARCRRGAYTRFSDSRCAPSSWCLTLWHRLVSSR